MAEVSPLRQRVIDDMMIRDLSPANPTILPLRGSQVQPAFRPLAEVRVSRVGQVQQFGSRSSGGVVESLLCQSRP
jgi:hypothetical protein